MPLRGEDADPPMAKIFYHAVPTDWRKEEKYAYLEKAGSIKGVKNWQKLKPDKKHNWLDLGFHEEFDHFLPLGDRDAHAGGLTPPVFGHYSRGVATSRDADAVNFDRDRVAKNMAAMIDAYNAQVDAYHRLKKKPTKVEDFIDYESGKIAWSDVLKKSVVRGVKTEFTEANVRPSLYRPFTSTSLYFDSLFNERRYGFPDIFPKLKSKNLSLCVTDAASEKPFMSLATDKIADLHLVGAGASTQCFPLHVYSEDGKSQQDNVTQVALVRFQNFYGDDALTRADVFYYVYAVLHHPAYRTRYAENLKRELPRIPLIAADGTLHAPPVPGQPCSGGLRPPSGRNDEADGGHRPPLQQKQDAAVFHAFAAAGRKLADLHIHYETAKEFPLQRIENKEVPLDWRVEAMKLSKDKSALIYNDFLTLTGIPAEALDYRLGNRSALEWVIDQYRVSRDDQGKVTSDPNRLDDEQYIVRLVGQIITVSLETQKIVNALPQLRFEDEPEAK